MPQFTTGIEHVIVVMLENRSFDHLLGYNYPLPAGIQGASTSELPPNRDPVSGTPYWPTLSADYMDLKADPGHEPADVARQLGLPFPPSAAGIPSNDGFVANFLKHYPNHAPPDAALRCFAGHRFPALSFLAENYTVCTSWFSSVPGPTWPNRYFLHTGTSNGLYRSPSDAEIIALVQSGNAPFRDSVFTWLARNGLTWKIYERTRSQSRALRRMVLAGSPNPSTPGHNRYAPLAELAGDLSGKSGTRLPHYSFVEPLWVGPEEDDMHPGPADPRNADLLLSSIYNRLIHSPYWARTLLLVVFDEHGGIYDHIAPGPAMPPDAIASDPPGFDFDRLGLRVPAILISPRTTASNRRTDDTPYDHTSLIATLAVLFSLGSPPASLGRRAAAANSFLPGNLGPQQTGTAAMAPAADRHALHPYDAEVPPDDNQRALFTLATADALIDSLTDPAEPKLGAAALTEALTFHVRDLAPAMRSVGNMRRALERIAPVSSLD